MSAALTHDNPVRVRQVRAGVDVTLRHPVTVGTVEPIRIVRLRRPTLGDLRGLSLNDDELTADELIGLIVKLSGLSTEQVDAIDLEDLDPLGRAITGFFPKSQSGSEESAKRSD